MSRVPPATDLTVLAASDSFRIIREAFRADGFTDAVELDGLRSLHRTVGLAQWADWFRRKSQAIENVGHVGKTLQREEREITERFGSFEQLMRDDYVPLALLADMRDGDGDSAA